MFNKPKKKKVTQTKEEYKARAKKNRFAKKVDKKSKYATSFRKPKVTVTFDPDARKDFLTGFHKRKLERKTYHKQKLLKQLTEEKLKIRAQARKSIHGVSSSHSILPEVESIIGMTNAELQLEDEEKTSSQSFVMGSKTVTISSLDSIHMKLSDMSESDSEEDEKPDISKLDENGKPLPALGPTAGANVKNLMKKTTNSLLVNSKAYKASQRLKQKSKRSRGKNRLIRERKRDGAGKSEPSSAGPRSYQTGPNKSRKGKQKVKKGKGKKGKQ